MPYLPWLSDLGIFNHIPFQVVANVACLNLVTTRLASLLASSYISIPRQDFGKYDHQASRLLSPLSFFLPLFLAHLDQSVSWRGQRLDDGGLDQRKDLSASNFDFSELGKIQIHIQSSWVWLWIKFIWNKSFLKIK